LIIVPIVCHRCCLHQWQTGILDTGGKFAAGSVSLAPVANLPAVSTTLAKLVEKFAIGGAHLLFIVSDKVQESIYVG
jgi:hypothetical protein